MALGPGTLLGTNIFLERQLGGGAMGEVWVAENRSLGSKVAVKVLHRRLAGDDHALGRFRQEAKAVASIDSPHVVKIFDFGMTPEGEPYIVMELLAGRDLAALIEQAGALSVENAATIFSQLCRALGRAHELGVIHRDIKPANVFIIESDGVPFVKVLDFGIARIHRDADMAMTETGALMGTPYYMSPEQFVDPRRIDHRSDLWSAAVVAYGCLVGSLPFEGETIGALSLAVHSGTFALPSQKNPSLPIALDAFFQRALQVDPGHRFATARELSSAFSVACGALSTSASHAPTVNPSAPPAQKKSSSAVLWVGVLLAVLGIGALLVAFVLPSLQSGDRRTAKATSESKSKSKSKKKKNGKKKKKKKKSDKEEGDEPVEDAAPPVPAPTATASETAAPAPAPSPAPAAPPPVAPKPAPLRYAYIGTACFAYSNKSCPKASTCCSPSVGGGPRDIAVYRDRPGKERGECRCMRPVCGPGQNWSTHQCIIK